jgi:hypothetical protein
LSASGPVSPLEYFSGYSIRPYLPESVTRPFFQLEMVSHFRKVRAMRDHDDGARSVQGIDGSMLASS